MASTHKRAKESAFIKRTRNKLERRLKEIDSKITSQALKEVTQNIHKWIRRHSAEREKIPGLVKVFDQNTHPAQEKSLYVLEKLKQIKEESKKEYGKLRGRISSPGESS